MAQVLFADKIGTLSHGSGIITLTASCLTIGGQQYVNTTSLSRTISTDVTLAANVLYMIYAVRNAGNTELRISTNVNSIGPAGFLSWKLVGAFYSNNLTVPLFGSFVNIEGVPSTSLMDIDVTSPNSSWTSVTNFAGKSKYHREGKFLSLVYKVTLAGAQGIEARLSIPANISSSSVYSTASSEMTPIGSMWTNVNLDIVNLGVQAGTTWMFLANYRLNTYQGDVPLAANAIGNAAFVMTARIAIEEWSNTPIKDL